MWCTPFRDRNRAVGRRRSMAAASSRERLALVTLFHVAEDLRITLVLAATLRMREGFLLRRRELVRGLGCRAFQLLAFLGALLDELFGLVVVVTSRLVIPFTLNFRSHCLCSITTNLVR